jgi:hypothetical protein
LKSLFVDLKKLAEILFSFNDLAFLKKIDSLPTKNYLKEKLIIITFKKNWKCGFCK